jgi:hypothetical protein
MGPLRRAAARSKNEKMLQALPNSRFQKSGTAKNIAWHDAVLRKN